jgi:hypothetical protein
MDEWFSMISGGRQFPALAAKELQDAGFVVIPGPVARERLAQFAAAYDATMDSGNGADVKVARTTTRMYDFVNQGAEFDDLYIYPLLEACRHVIGAPFKLSTILGRTLRPRSFAQDLHVDIKRDSEDLPMAGFILMVDEFRPDNGATRRISKELRETWRQGVTRSAFFGVSPMPPLSWRNG